jgi:HlyD family secretion protein
MKMVVLGIVFLSGLAGFFGYVLCSGASGASGVMRAESDADCQDRVAANGVVEGARPEIGIRAEVVGRIMAVHCQEGEDVAKDTVLIELANETQKQQVALAQAELTMAQAQLDLLTSGPRPEKRQALAALARARRAVYLQAKDECQRARTLSNRQAISQEQSEGAYFKMLRTEAELREAEADQALVEGPAREEDMTLANARVLAARARVRTAEAELARTRIRAPRAGRILQTHAEPGELAGPGSSQPLLLLADLSRLRVRAFVEELDALRVAPGQAATITVDGLAGKVFHGRVARVMPRMGTRAAPADLAAERKDMYYREVLIDLEPGKELPLNLRVQVQIHPGAGPALPAAPTSAVQGPAVY